MSRKFPVYEFLLALFGVLCAVYFLEITSRASAQGIADLHQIVLSGTAESPWRYRLLSVWAVELLRLFIPGDASVSINAAYMMGHALVFPIMMIVVYRWFARWMKADRAAFAAMILIALMPLALMNWGTSLYTPIEILFIAAACLLVQRKPTAALRIGYGILLILATLNRETGGLLAFIWLLAYARDRRELRTFAIYLGIFIALQLGLRAELGYVSHNYTPAWLIGENLGYWLPYGVRNNLFTLPLWVLAAARWRRADTRLRALALVVVIYAPMIVLFGQWHEIRLQFAAFVLLLPIIFNEKSLLDQT